LETQRQRGLLPSEHPRFSSQAYVQTAKGSLQRLLRKCKRKPVQAHGTDFLLGENAEEGEVFSSAFPQSARRGRMEYGCNCDYKNNGILYCNNV